MVIPRSRSIPMRSRYCARITRSSTIPAYCSIRSANVDLPWSIWAMMQKLRSSAVGVAPGSGTPRSGVPADGVLAGFVMVCLLFHHRWLSRDATSGPGPSCRRFWCRSAALLNFTVARITHSNPERTGLPVANIKSQIKRNRQNEAARERNRAVRSRLKTSIRRVNEAVTAGDGDKARELARQAGRNLDKAASKGVIHKNQAANRKSAVAKKANSVKSTTLQRGSLSRGTHLWGSGPFCSQSGAQAHKRWRSKKADSVLGPGRGDLQHQALQGKRRVRA